MNEFVVSGQNTVGSSCTTIADDDGMPRILVGHGDLENGAGTK